MDVVMLVVSLLVRLGEYVVEFGCGFGVVLLCVVKWLSDVCFIVWEVEEWVVELVCWNFVENGLVDWVEVYCGDIVDLLAEFFVG